jgi:hypothetical protein
MQASTPPLLDGAILSWLWSLPFIGLLLTIATGPLLFPRIWSRHYGKIAAGWSALRPTSCFSNLPAATPAN